MDNFVDKFERWITYVLMGVALLMITLQTYELLREMISNLVIRISTDGLVFKPGSMHSGVVLFFNILLSLEILATIRVFSKGHEVKIKVILIVCMIAVSRKFLAADTQEHDSLQSELGIAALILAFALGYYLVQKVEK
ncbi:phosphate-starvation-inducible PsiE family protein [Flavihumibacter petaseus]|uniref:Uncharacterized protein n=1 Tax=Flavihumibacter petaseus NBRC 106054 TaxID=1220578 RepID=A0A0E9MTJ7_9BACT|nr:phosphate-starvation-inducible PsiE family protein [Flavihumibacter petaseus]GAO41087.1 hypothetical protein FPE01S_01_00990 [Flavihumibacter petaseus NBRC 106054]